jgi:hypothetical protein
VCSKIVTTALKRNTHNISTVTNISFLRTVIYVQDNWREGKENTENKKQLVMGAVNLGNNGSKSNLHS